MGRMLKPAFCIFGRLGLAIFSPTHRPSKKVALTCDKYRYHIASEMDMAVVTKLLKQLVTAPALPRYPHSNHRRPPLTISASKMSSTESQTKAFSTAKTIDSHLHIWASPEEVISKSHHQSIFIS